MTPERAFRQFLAFGCTALVIFAVRIVAYGTLDETQWPVFDLIVPAGAGWFCFALAAWRVGFISGHRTKDRP